MKERRLENLKEGRFISTRGEFLPRFQINGWLFDVPSQEKDQKCRCDSNEKQPAPGNRRRQQRKKQGIEQRGHSPADCPACLHGTQSLSSMLCAHRFTQQDCAGSPFTAESKAEECAGNEHLRIVLGEAGNDG